MYATRDVNSIRQLSILVATLVVIFLETARAEEPRSETSSSLSVSRALDEPTEAGPAAFRPCAFQQITPGVAKLDDVLQLLGNPAEELENDGARTWIYKIEPFDKVALFLDQEIVTSIVLHLRAPASPRQIAKELALENFDPTPVISETGQTLGRAFPERGVLMNFVQDSSELKVSELVLEPISAELFVLRVKNDTRHRYQQNLADLDAALALDPANVDALCHQARILAITGQFERAFTTIEQALSLKSSDARFVLQKAEILAKLERHDEALIAVKSVVDDQSHPVAIRARAECLWGDLLSSGPSHDFAKAIEHHLRAIKLATPPSSEQLTDVRREAKQTVLNGFLGAAHDIAAGNWQRRHETATKWLDGARELAEATVARDGGDETQKLQVLVATLVTQEELGGDTDPGRWVASVTREAKRLAEASGDGLFERQLAMEQARALLAAAGIEHARDGKLKAFDYATQATEIVGRLSNQKELSAADRYLIGRLYFFVGSSHAVLHQNHTEAARWYKKALALFDDPLAPSVASDVGRHGERLVSIGASYWENGDHENGLEMTRRGLELMKQAAKQKLIGDEKLALPYSNLAAMYQSLGRADEAKTYSETASRLNAVAEQSKRR